MEENTTITLKKTTKDRLDDVGRKPESYDDILVKLLDLYEIRRTDQIIDEKSEK